MRPRTHKHTDITHIHEPTHPCTRSPSSVPTTRHHHTPLPSVLNVAVKKLSQAAGTQRVTKTFSGGQMLRHPVSDAHGRTAEILAVPIHSLEKPVPREPHSKTSISRKQHHRNMLNEMFFVLFALKWVACSLFVLKTANALHKDFSVWRGFNWKCQAQLPQRWPSRGGSDAFQWSELLGSRSTARSWCNLHVNARLPNFARGYFLASQTLDFFTSVSSENSFFVDGAIF